MFVFLARMSGWAKKGQGDNSIQKIQNLFDRAVACYKEGNEECRPNQFAYAILVHAYATSKTVEGAEKAEQILHEIAREYKVRMQESKDTKSPLSSELVVVPNTQLVTATMDCWQKSGAPDAGHRAEALLNWMIELAKDTGCKEMQPNAYSFSCAIASWARTSTPGKATRARQLLVQMTKLHREGKIESPPNAYCFTNVINSCAYCLNEESEMKSSLAIAIQTYKELLKSDTLQPTHVTFSTFLTALRNLLPRGKERTQAVRTVFAAAVKLGQVDPLVIRKTQAAVSKTEDLQEIIPLCCWENGQVQADKIPSSWSRNVVVQYGRREERGSQTVS